MGSAFHGSARRLHYRTSQSIASLNDLPPHSGNRLDPTGSTNRHRQLRYEFAASTRTDQSLGKTPNLVEEKNPPTGLTPPDRRPNGRCENPIFSGKEEIIL